MDINAINRALAAMDRARQAMLDVVHSVLVPFQYRHKAQELADDLEQAIAVLKAEKEHS